MSETLFEKIIQREIPAEIIYEDDLSIVINDIHPQAPIHLLIIPKKVIPKLSDGVGEDQMILGHLMLVAGKVADQLNLDETFRIIINNGAKAGQSVFHLHNHEPRSCLQPSERLYRIALCSEFFIFFYYLLCRFSNSKNVF